MVRHDEIGDYQIEFCKEAAQVTYPVIGGSVKAGDHTVLLLVVTFVATASVQQPTKDFTVTIEDSADNSTWAAVAGSAVTRSVTGQGAKDFGQDLWVIDRNNVRRWVRAYFTTTTNAYSLTGAWIKAGNKVNSVSTQTNIIKL